MSGHSHAANIAAKKAKTDAVKGKIFTKVGREIAVAAKNNPDIFCRFRLPSHWEGNRILHNASLRKAQELSLLPGLFLLKFRFDPGQYC